MTLKLGILASGSGSNAQAMFDAVARGALDADIRLVISNRPDAGVLTRASTHRVPSLCLDHTAYADRESHDLAVISAFRDANVDTVALAGYMRLLSPAFLDVFPNRVLNIHPALLPAFPGVHGAADAHAWGVRISGCTVHIVSHEMDCGPIIIQACVPVMQGEGAQELQSRIQVLEHRVYPQALQWLAEERLELQGRCVRLAPPRNTQQASYPTEMPFIWPPLEVGF